MALVVMSAVAPAAAQTDADVQALPAPKSMVAREAPAVIFPVPTTTSETPTSPVASLGIDPLPLFTTTTLGLAESAADLLNQFGIARDDLFLFQSETSATAEQSRLLEARQHFFLGSYHLENNQPAHAVGEFKAALEADPTNPNIRLGLAEAHMASGDGAAAESTLAELITKDPKHVRALLTKARILLNRGQTASAKERTATANTAVELLKTALTVQPKNVDVLRTLADAYLMQRDVPKILETYRNIVSNDPKDLQAVLTLANLLARTGSNAEAITMYERIIDQRRGFVRGYLELGQLYEQEGRIADAIDVFKRGLLIEAQNPDLLTGFRELMTRSGGPAAMTTELEKFAKAYPNSVAVQRLFADHLLVAKEYARAKQQYEKILALDPENVDVVVNLANVYLQEKNYDEATRYFSRAIELQPDRTDVYNSIAFALVNIRDREKALQVYRRALTLNPKAERLYVNLAALQAEDGKITEAIDTLQKGVSFVGEKPDLLALLGRYYERTGDTSATLAYFVKAYAAAEQNPSLFAKLLTVLVEQKRPQAEVDALIARGEKAFSSRRTEFYTLAAEALYSEGMLELSAKFFLQATELSPLQTLLTGRPTTVLNATNRTSESLTLLNKYLPEAKSPENRTTFLRLLAETYLAQKDFGTADATARKILAEKPDAVLGYQLLVDIWTKAKDLRKVETLLNEAEKVVGKKDEFTLLRGIAFYQNKRYADAERIFRTLSQSSEPENADIYLYYLGSVYLEQKRYDLAESTFRKAIASNPSNDSAINALAYMFADRNRNLQEARELAQQALLLNPGGPHILDTVGWVYYRLGNFPKALELIERAHQIMGPDAEVLDHLGDVHAAMGNMDLALKAWNESESIDATRPKLKEKIRNASKAVQP